MASKFPIRIALKGEALLANARWNKGTAFTRKERKQFGLTSRLPYQVNSLEDQCSRAYEQLKSHSSPISQNTYLQSLRSQNWVLYYALLSQHLKELMPILYSPTQADAISQYSHLYQTGEGMFLTYANQETMEQDFVHHVKDRDIDLVVCSDAESILGIGDQGVGGIGITTTKSVVYSLLARIDPAKILSVVLDVGTDNKELRNDAMYLGWANRRVRGEDYDDFIDRFVQLVRKHCPHSLLHFEDFGVTNAQRLLSKYRKQHACFNDDVQGTGAVTMAALMAAVEITKRKFADHRIVIYGAGSAGLGIAKRIRDAMKETDNLSREEANERFWLVDRLGLIKQSLGDDIRPEQAEFVRPDKDWKERAGGDGRVSLLDVVTQVRPTVLIGCSTHAGAFTEEVVKEMALKTAKPIIFPLSNPSRLAELDPNDGARWTEGRALIATGSPFPPITLPDGGEYAISECNNAIIYPGLGFGAVLAQSRILTDTMIIAGAKRLAALSPALKKQGEPLLPDFAEAPKANFEVAVAVAEQAIDEGSAGVTWGKDEVRTKAKEKQWKPVYNDYVFDSEGES